MESNMEPHFCYWVWPVAGYSNYIQGEGVRAKSPNGKAFRQSIMLAVRFQTRNATGFHSIPCQFGCAWWFSQKQWKEKHSSPYSPENHHYLMISHQKLPQEAGQIPALRRTKLRSFGGAMPRPQRRRKLIEHGEECEAQGTHHHINIQTYRRIINRYWISHYNIYIYNYI